MKVEKKKKKIKEQCKYIHVVGLNLKGGLLADKPKKKRKASVLVLSHKEEERR
jgi:predicted nucleotidyltransferase